MTKTKLLCPKCSPDCVQGLQCLAVQLESARSALASHRGEIKRLKKHLDRVIAKRNQLQYELELERE